MTTIQWDQTGSRFYESGVDRGVLYLADGSGVPWNGLSAVNEKLSGDAATPVYFDGVKFANITVPGDYAATLKAFTYPDEFLEFEGVVEIGNGLFAANQQASRFGLSYRTKIGNDVDGEDHAYKIHVLYNLIATPSQKNYQSTGSDLSPVEFEWDISAIPAKFFGFRPTAHVIFDTRKMSSILLKDIEDTLYGDGSSPPVLPPLSTLASFVGEWVIIRITDNYDGTWTATGPDSLVSLTDSTTFQILKADADYEDASTYDISDLTY